MSIIEQMRLKLFGKKGFSTITVIVLILILFVFLLLILFFVNSRLSKKSTIPVVPIASPTPSSPTFASNAPTGLPLQRSTINKTTDAEVKQLSGLAGSSVQPDGSTVYNFSSPLSDRADQIITKNGVAEFEREILPLEASSTGHSSISSLVSQYGQPDMKVQGSKYYDWSATTYIYANKGLAFIGNQNSDTVFEIQVFLPTSVDQYTQQYGQDLNPGAQPPKEGGGPSTQQQAVMNFKASLPYVTPDMGIRYDKSTDKTTVVINQSNKDTGIKAFNDYLTKFGITDQSQINNLSIIYQ